MRSAIVVGLLAVAACGGGDDDARALEERAESAVWRWGREDLTDAEFDEAVDGLVESCNDAEESYGAWLAIVDTADDRYLEALEYTCPAVMVGGPVSEGDG